MKNKIFHLYAPNPGGISDYVDAYLFRESKNNEKISINKKKIQINQIPERCLLHYSGYGFSKRGAPLWLLNKIETERPRINSLGIFFHELYASGPPWGSAFWLSPVQKHIARRLAELSDFWITNREGSAQWLRPFAGDKPHAVLPVFSNVGEMPAYSSVRVPKIVVFGGAALRMATYRAAGNALFVWAQAQGLEIHDIGPAISDPVILKSLRDAHVVQHGRLAKEEVSSHLSDASFGILAYSVDYVAKSGVFAAYCAHGVCPVLIAGNFVPSDGLIPSAHYLTGLPVDVDLGITVKKIGDTAWHWYQTHNLAAHGNKLKQLLCEAGTA